MGAVANKIEEIVSRCDASVRRRRRTEIRIVRRVVRDLLKAGYQLFVVDNDWAGEEANTSINNSAESLERLFDVDDEYLYVAPKGFKQIAGRGTGTWVRFVFGNDGWDVICDYTTNLEGIIEPISEWIDEQVDKGVF